jgi:integrase
MATARRRFVRRKSAGLVVGSTPRAPMRPEDASAAESAPAAGSRAAGATLKVRRAYGTGSLLVSTAADGREIWYGRWRAEGKRLNRRLGAKRRRATGEGLTRTEAEARLRRMMTSERPPLAEAEVPFASAAEHLLRHLEVLGRKPTTLDNYRSILRARLIPELGDVMVDRITPGQVEAVAAEMLREGKAAKTRASALKLLSQVISFAQRRGWCRDNPCPKTGKAKVRESTDIRFLDRTELEALVAAVDVSAEPFGHTDRAIFLTAAMTGMRQGELLALRWRDVDWGAKKIRVRRNYVRGHWDTPKSRSGERSVPLASRVATELERQRRRSRFRADTDLVFPHPLTGNPLDHASLLRRFKRALKAGGVRQVRFLDLRHTFGTRMAASPHVSMRKIQEWMGHRDYRTTLIYADYEPGDNESAMVDAAFS